MAIDTTFNPAYGRGVVVTPAASSASTALGRGSKSIVVTNSGAGLCYVATGDSSVTASSADYPVLQANKYPWASSKMILTLPISPLMAQPYTSLLAKECNNA